MNSHPRDDNALSGCGEWDRALPAVRRVIGLLPPVRLEAAGPSAEQAQSVLADGGDRLYAAALAGDPRLGSRESH